MSGQPDTAMKLLIALVIKMNDEFWPKTEVVGKIDIQEECS
jgi:hypothetical protein